MDEMLRQRILTALHQYYREQNVYPSQNTECSTKVCRNEVIGNYRNGNYRTNIRNVLGAVGIVFENPNSHYIRRIIYKDSESEGGRITREYNFNGFSEGSQLYVASKVGTRNETTIQDVLRKIEKDKAIFQQEFILKEFGELNGQEKSITLNANKGSTMNIYHFIIVEKNEILIGQGFTYISTKTMFKRNFLSDKMERYNNGEESDIGYYCEVYYDRESQDFKSEFENRLKFYSLGSLEGIVCFVLNGNIVRIGRIFIGNNENIIKANNNAIVGKIITSNDDLCVVTVANEINIINIVGKVELDEINNILILRKQNNLIGEFNLIDDIPILFLRDMNNLLTQHLIRNMN